VDSKLTPANRCLPKNNGPLKGTLQKLLWALSLVLYLKILTVCTLACFLGVHILKASIRHHKTVSSSGFNVLC